MRGFAKMAPVILLADNDPNLLSEANDYFSVKGFKVINAASREEARKILNDESIDAAVIDIRLSDDNDPHDIGGLEIARQSRREIPIILYSSYHTSDVLRDAFKANVGLPPLTTIVNKAEGLNALLEAVRAAASHKLPNVQSAARKLRIFLCHSSKDKPRVRTVYHELKNEGMDPWLDEEKLLPGQPWEFEIKRAVKTSDIVIVFLSQSSVSQRGFVQKEIKYALDVADEQPEGTIFIIPVKLEECQIPERLGQWQWVNYWEPNAHEKLLLSLRHRASEIA